MPSAVAVVAGVIAARPAFAVGITSPVTASAVGVGRASSVVTLGLVLLAAAGTPTPVLAVLGRAGMVPLLAGGAPLLGVQQLALL